MRKNFPLVTLSFHLAPIIMINGLSHVLRQVASHYSTITVLSSSGRVAKEHIFSLVVNYILHGFN
jgi:hypothetical protein